MSLGVEYVSLRSKISGERYQSVTTFGVKFLGGCMIFRASPKSATFSVPCLLISRFDSLRSLKSGNRVKCTCEERACCAGRKSLGEAAP